MDKVNFLAVYDYICSPRCPSCSPSLQRYILYIDVGDVYYERNHWAVGSGQGPQSEPFGLSFSVSTSSLTPETLAASPGRVHEAAARLLG